MWYLITWFDKHGDALKCEVLHRDSIAKLWAFINGRIDRSNLPKGAQGFWFREALDIEIMDHDIGEDRTPGNHAEDLGVWDNAPEVIERIEDPQYVSDR
jgi:hypothetical protein